ncbi:MAG: hypothetical protein GX970_03950, partial [Phyllobacteriaceae bacterium]|nr:hypothetical protein [Phyllobacteriaceae bacterium]
KPDTLLHRSGRTGRAGRKGTCVVIAPAHRKRVALSILRTAKIEAEMIAPPSAEAIDARFEQFILDNALLTDAITEEEQAQVANLVEKWPAETLAAAYLRLLLQKKPVPEDITAFDIDAPREPRSRDAFAGGAWFKVSVGRKQRAEPRWLLPMICKAGGMGKSAIGSIRIFDTETIFEVAADKVDAFQKAVDKRGGTLEKGVYVSQVDGPGERAERPQAKRRPPGPPERYDPMAPRPEKADRKQRYGSGKLRPDDFEQPSDAQRTRPQERPAEFSSERPAAERPAKVRKAPAKDKGKPKWSKPVAEGEARLAKKPKKDHKKSRAE